MLLSVGLFVMRWPIPDLAKWAAIAPASFAIVVLLYEFLIRRFNVLRFLLGMRVAAGQKRPARAPAGPAAAPMSR